MTKLATIEEHVAQAIRTLVDIELRVQHDISKELPDDEYNRILQERVRNVTAIYCAQVQGAATLEAAYDIGITLRRQQSKAG